MAEPLSLDERQDAIEEFVREGLSTMAKKIRDDQKKLEERLFQIKDHRFVELEATVSSLQDIIESKERTMEAGPSTSAFQTFLVDSDEDVTPAKVRKTSTPFREEFVPPCTLEDFGNTSLSKKLEVYVAEGIHENEKLTLVQLGFVRYYLEENPRATAKSADILELIKAGTAAKMWSRTWKPTGIKADLFAYLKEKVKNLVCQRRVMSTKSGFMEALLADLEH